MDAMDSQVLNHDQMAIRRCLISTPSSAADAMRSQFVDHVHMAILRSTICSPHGAMNATSAQISNYLHIAIARSTICTVLGTTTSSFVKRLHQPQMTKLSCLVWFHVSHGSARNQ